MRAMGRGEPLPIALYRSIKKAQAAPARNGTTTTTHNRRSTKTVYRRSGGGFLAIVCVRLRKDRSCSSNSRPSNRWSKPAEAILLAPKCLPLLKRCIDSNRYDPPVNTDFTNRYRLRAGQETCARCGVRKRDRSPKKYLNSRGRALRRSASSPRKGCRAVMFGLLPPARVELVRHRAQSTR